jgi:hypothetical protein
MARLKKGQTASGVAVRSQRASESVLARVRLLHELESSPINEERQLILQSFLKQGTLTRLSIPECGIHPASEKTLRKHLESHEVSFEDLSQRASGILSRLNPPLSEKPSKESTRFDDVQKVESTLDVTARYLDLLERLEKICINSDAVSLLLQKHFHLFHGDHLKPHLRRVK